MKPCADAKSYIAAVCAGQATGLCAPIISPLTVGGLIQQMGIGEAEAGSLITCELLTIAVVSMAIAPVVHRLSIRRLAMIGALLMIAANLVSANTTLLSSLYGWRVLAGLGNGLVLAAANSASARSRSPALLFSLGWGAIYVVISLTSLFISQVADVLSHTLVYYCLTAIVFVAWPVLLFLPATPAQPQSSGFPRATIKAGMLLLLGIATIGFAMMAYYAFVERIAVNAGADTGNVAAIIVAVSIAGIIGGFSAAPLALAFGIIRPLLVATLLHALAITLAIYGSSLMLMAGGAVCEGLLFIVISPLMLSLAAELDAAGRWATAAGGIFLLAASLGPIGGGGLIQYSGFPALAWLNLVCALPGCLAFVRAHRQALNLRPEAATTR